MNSELQNTWKTIVNSVAIENADLTYKIDKVRNTCFNDLPTVKIQSKDEEVSSSLSQDTISIGNVSFGEIDDMAATEPMTIGGDRSGSLCDETMVADSGSFPDETVCTFADKTEEMVKISDCTEVDETMATVVDDKISNITMIETPQMVDFSAVPQVSYITEETISLENRTQDLNQNTCSTLQIYQEIARGGMGIILKGKQNSLRREIAIKRLHDEDDEVSKKKFVMEARVTAFLDHPNIIPIHELGIDVEGNPLLTMKLVRGKSWKQLFHDEKDQKNCTGYVQKHLEILLRVSDALAYAHSKKIVHNDLKPANIMVGEFGEVFLMDWGIAVSLDKSENAPTLYKTSVDTPMGTPNYMAPELANGHGEKIGPWTDVYLLGGILYYILTGKAPHHSGNIWESIRLSSEGHVPEISEKIPQELRDICYKTLQKDPEDRYRNVEELQDAIHKFLRHWESINITKEAKEFLDFGHGVLKDLSNNSVEEVRKKIPNPYCPISRALFGFNEALRIWPENPDAIAGQREGFVLYCEIAIFHKDFNLAERVMSDMDNLEDARRLKEKLQKAIASDSGNNSDSNRSKNTHIAIAIIIAVIGFALGKLL